MVQYEGKSIFLIIFHMFTRNIKQSILLGKSGVRWKGETPPAQLPAEVNPIDQAKELLKKIKDSFLDAPELKQLRELLKKAKENNDAQKDALYRLLNDALKDNSGFSYGDKLDLQKIKDDWDKDFNDAERMNTVAKD